MRPPLSSGDGGAIYSMFRSCHPPGRQVRERQRRPAVIQRRRGQDAVHGHPAVRRIEVELVANPSFLVSLRVALRATSHARGRSASVAASGSASWRSRRRRGGRSSPLRGRPLGSAVSGPVPCPSEEEFAAFCIQDSRQDWSSSADHSALRLSDPSVAITARVADPEPGAAAPDASTPAALLRL